MRGWLLALGLASACTFDPSGVPPGDGATGSADGDDGSGVPAAWRDDSADELATGGGDTTVIEPWGAIAPAPRLVGALVARGTQTELFTDPATADWAALIAATPTGVGASALGALVLIDRAPVGVGVTGGDHWTWWAEGDVFLEAGAHSWQLDADDAAFVDLAPPGADAFTRVISATFPDPATATYQAPATGWYRVRTALVQGLGRSGYRLLHRGPGEQALTALPSFRLRAPARGLAGLVAYGYDDAWLLAPRTVALAAVDALAADWGADRPRELGIDDGDTFSVRWSGQARIDVAGAYRFHVSSDDGHRLWVDGRLLLDRFAEELQEAVTPSTELGVGWHDLVLDLSENTGQAAIDLDVMDGPELAGAIIPRARLRPAPGRAERVAGATDGADRALPDRGEVAVPMAIALPDGAVAGRIDVGVNADHPRWRDLEIAVRAPDGTEQVAVAAGTLSGVGNRTERLSMDTFAGRPGGGLWTVIVRDRASSQSGTVLGVAVTVHYRGGEPSLIGDAVFESRVAELGDVVGFDAVAWQATTPPGTDVTVTVRTCDEAAACAAEPWSAPVGNGARPAAAPRRLAQYRVELFSRGDAAATVDWVELRYRTRAP